MQPAFCALLVAAIALPGASAAQVARVPPTRFVAPPPVSVPLAPMPMTATVRIAPSPTATLTPSANGVPAGVQAESWSVNVQVVPPPEPPDEPLDTDECHDDKPMDDVDPCDNSLAPPEQTDLAPEGAASNLAEAAVPEPAPAEPPSRGFNWWWMALAVVLGALVVGWIGKMRHR